MVLLDGCVAGRQKHRECLRALPQRRPRRAEVKEDRLPVFRQIDVRRLEVAMEEAFAMDMLETVQSGHHDLQGVPPRELPATESQVGVKAPTVIEIHDKVGGAEFLEVSPHA
jgi:hypothetical protein